MIENALGFYMLEQKNSTKNPLIRLSSFDKKKEIKEKHIQKR